MTLARWWIFRTRRVEGSERSGCRNVRAIVYAEDRGAEQLRDPALMSKLTGDVDRDKLLELAPGELHQLDGWSGPARHPRQPLVV